MPTPLNGSLLKGFAILNLFSKNRMEITISIVTRELGMNTATAHRFLITLENVGALVSYRRGGYSLGQRLKELGDLTEFSDPLPRIAQPFIDKLSVLLNESIMVCRLSRDGVICIGNAISSRPISVNIQVGRVLEIHATAHGKIWLAYMDEAEKNHYLNSLSRVKFTKRTLTEDDEFELALQKIRNDGYAVNSGERETDIGAVAVPIFDKNKKIVASLSVFGMLSRFDDKFIADSYKLLVASADEIAIANAQYH